MTTSRIHRGAGASGDAAGDATPYLLANEPDWALPAMRERVARNEAGIDVLKNDVLTLRERGHTLSGELQRLIGETSILAKAVERLSSGQDEQDRAHAALATEVKNHVTGCREENLLARAERAAFRREMRGYMVGLLATAITTALIYLIAGKLHLPVS